MYCGARSDGQACEEQASFEVSFGGVFDVALCDTHLTELRVASAGWGTAEAAEFDLVTRPLPRAETAEETIWARGRSRGRRWAHVTATAEDLQLLADAIQHEMFVDRATQCLAIARQITAEELRLPTAGVELPASLSGLDADKWLAGFVDGALEPRALSSV